VKIVERRLLLLDGSSRTVHGCLERAIVDADDELARIDMLVVLDENLIDMPGNPWRQRCDMAADIGIVGRHQEPAGLPPLKAIPAGDADRDRRAQHDQRLARLFAGAGIWTTDGCAGCNSAAERTLFIGGVPLHGFGQPACCR